MNDNEKIRYNNFIEKLYNSPSSTSQDKERIVKLLLSEREKGFVTEEKVREIVTQIMGNTRVLDGKQDATSSTKKKKFYHKPQDMVKFLYQFSVNEKLKYFTHIPDTDTIFYYSDYINHAEKYFKDLTDKLSINASTFTNIRNFIFNTGLKAQDSYNNRIELGWKDMSEWCTANNGKHPFDVLVGDFRFEHYINIFKNAIQFRTDNSDYLFNKRVRIFIQKEAINSSDVKIIFTTRFRSIGSSTRTFIDVRQFFSFLRIIGKWIIENKTKGNTVEVDLSEEDNSYSLSIFHAGSYLNLDDEKLKGLSGDFKRARNIMLNVADWTIMADEYRRGPLCINCLCNTTQNEEKSVVSENIIEKTSNPIGGVKHIITFYKNI